MQCRGRMGRPSQLLTAPVVNQVIMFIDGLGFSGYRSFSGSLQEIGPFAKINLLIGQNNSGKSNVLSFINRYYVEAARALNKGNRARPSTIDLKLELLDRPVSDKAQTLSLAFGLRIGLDKYNTIITRSVVTAANNQPD